MFSYFYKHVYSEDYPHYFSDYSTGNSKKYEENIFFELTLDKWSEKWRFPFYAAAGVRRNKYQSLENLQAKDVLLKSDFYADKLML